MSPRNESVARKSYEIEPLPPVIPVEASEEFPLAQPETTELPLVEIDWDDIITGSPDVGELVKSFRSSNDEEKKAIADRIEAARNYWLVNRDEIVEGVLNTAEIIDEPGYVDGSGSGIRLGLGNKVRAIGGGVIEKRVRDLLKLEMAEYFEGDRIRLAGAAIAKAPSLPSLYEVIKRFGQLDEADKAMGGIYTRSRLKDLYQPILALDEDFDQKLDAYKNEALIPDSSDLETMSSKISTLCQDLPQSMGIKNITLEKLTNKLNLLSQLASKGSETKTLQAQPGGSSFFSRLSSRVKGWWGR